MLLNTQYVFKTPFKFSYLNPSQIIRFHSTHCNFRQDVLLTEGCAINCSLGFDRDGRGGKCLPIQYKDALKRGGVALTRQFGTRVKQSVRLSSKINKGKLFAAAHRVLLDKQDFVIRDYRIRRCYKIVYVPHKIIPNEVIISLATP